MGVGYGIMGLFGMNMDDFMMARSLREIVVYPPLPIGYL